jgi:hypothetical protein
MREYGLVHWTPLHFNRIQAFCHLSSGTEQLSEPRSPGSTA